MRFLLVPKSDALCSSR